MLTYLFVNREMCTGENNTSPFSSVDNVSINTWLI